MYVNELMAIARQNELRDEAERARLVRHARRGRPRMLVRSLGAAREQLRNLTASSAGRAHRESPQRGAAALR
jgi:hypothetical protein